MSREVMTSVRNQHGLLNYLTRSSIHLSIEISCVGQLDSDGYDKVREG